MHAGRTAPAGVTSWVALSTSEWASGFVQASNRDAGKQLPAKEITALAQPQLLAEFMRVMQAAGFPADAEQVLRCYHAQKAWSSCCCVCQPWQPVGVPLLRKPPLMPCAPPRPALLQRRWSCRLMQLATMAVLAQVHAEVQRWGSSFKEGCMDEPCLWDPGLQLGLCGDCCRESSAAGAISSGLAMAEQLEQHFAQARSA